MAKKPKKKNNVKKHDKRNKYSFTCLRCKFLAELRASSMTEAEGTALLMHDDHNTASGFFCPGDHFDIREE